jgi:AraC family transcriptional regulator, melibiose operon regulatory protein
VECDAVVQIAVRNILLESEHFYLFFGLIMSFPEVTHEFDEGRPAFSPYGLACVRWRATRMGRPDRHNEIELNLLESGAVTYLLSGRRVTLRPGRLAAFWAIAPHQIIASEDENPYFVATIPFNIFLQWRLAPRFLNSILGGALVEARSESAGRDRLLFEQWIQDLQGGSAELVEIALLEMQARVRRMALHFTAEEGEFEEPAPRPLDVKDSSKVEQMAMYVSTNYHRRMKVEEISAVVDLHPDYASALFKKSFGMTLGKYVLEHRISHAQRMLSTTREKISTVALKVGFESMSRFNASFKVAAGCTPREYRMTHSR